MAALWVWAKMKTTGLVYWLSWPNLPHHPESVPVNMLVKVKGTPMENVEDLDPFEFIRVLAVARIMMPASHVRLVCRSGNDE